MEDARETPEAYAWLLRDLTLRGHKAFVHEASVADISRDSDAARRRQSLSKLQKYPKLRASWRSRAELSAEFGDIKNDNDLGDCQLLAAVKDGAADFLITEDAKLHTRARRHGVGSQVLRVREALDFINGQYADVDFELNSISRRYCYQVDVNDPIFRSLEDDYEGFISWYKEKCCGTQRECWVVQDARSIAAICIFKAETAGEAPIGVLGGKILKLCTFKVAENYRGGRLGEQLLRQALCYAYDNGYDSIYLTVYPKQLGLRQLIHFYGFRRVAEQANGELVFLKSWTRSEEIDAGRSVAVRRRYPQLPSRFPSGLVVPVQPGYHDRLFPEGAGRFKDMPGDLFANSWLGPSDRQSPSNSIRKAYLAFARLREVPKGTLATFYRSTDTTIGIRSGLTAIGVVESYRTASSVEEAIEVVAKRSVYTNDEIAQMSKLGGLKILKFIFYGYVEKPIELKELIGAGVLRGAPQSLVRLDEDRLSALLEMIRGQVVSG